MGNEYLVSVVIPLFNAEKYIEKAVLSASGLAEVGELILVGDGSMDGSLQLSQQLSER
ncbi:glycosyltransferase family 2 protein [Cyclobacterium jeungdonense]|uniref:Glycosyltransferase n=1 Tax=Cyclobacterium jeungdonense TaxID=708087 RepID=A0ABT8C156_9BACT|nr:glycosyltransferase [Cyclobacterium jeungdonense]MDN3686528.1 glycosyltransferase [Cyclobacterium jeungdonense]